MEESFTIIEVDKGLHDNYISHLTTGSETKSKAAVLEISIRIERDEIAYGDGMQRSNLHHQGQDQNPKCQRGGGTKVMRLGKQWSVWVRPCSREENE